MATTTATRATEKHPWTPDKKVSIGGSMEYLVAGCRCHADPRIPPDSAVFVDEDGHVVLLVKGLIP
jgi:hypothetical protein